MPCPDLYYCVTEACNVLSSENAVESSCVAIGQPREVCLSDESNMVYHNQIIDLPGTLEILRVAADAQFPRARREVDGFKLS